MLRWMAHGLKQNTVSYFLLDVMVEYDKRDYVFMFGASIGLENWSDNSHKITLPHQHIVISHP